MELEAGVCMKPARGAARPWQAAQKKPVTVLEQRFAGAGRTRSAWRVGRPVQQKGNELLARIRTGAGRSKRESHGAAGTVIAALKSPRHDQVKGDGGTEMRACEGDVITAESA